MYEKPFWMTPITWNKAAEKTSNTDRGNVTCVNKMTDFYLLTLVYPWNLSYLRITALIENKMTTLE